MVSANLSINTAVSKWNKTISLPPHWVRATNELPLKADHRECYHLVLKWECKLNGKTFITDDCRIISELLECLGRGLVHTKGSNAQRNMLLIKTASIVQEMGMLHVQCWQHAAVLTPRPHIPGSKHFSARINWFLSHPVCSDWISVLAIMTNSPCQQWLITCPGCRHQPRGGDLLGWYWVGQRGIWTWRWLVLHDTIHLLMPKSSLSFLTLSSYFLQRKLLSQMQACKNFGGRRSFHCCFFNGNQIVISKQPGLPAS